VPRRNNLQIAEMLEQVAELLEIKQADAFRVAAYRRAARAVSEAGILGRSIPRVHASPVLVSADIPPVELILAIDAEYRRRAQGGELKRIAPRRFNPEGKAWLPLFQTRHQGWSFTALFSNTARAHQLGKTSDWVVIFYERGQQVGQCTVVTERRGLMTGKRVVRGREAECRSVYFLRPAFTQMAWDDLPPGGAGPLAAAG
jgi:hypothetical protein